MRDSLVLELAEVDPAQWPLVGGKAANLATLYQAGFPVPAGLCVTTAAFDLAQKLYKDEVATGKDSVFELPVHEVVQVALRKMLPDIVDDLDGPLAVRSSATLEDAQEQSYAGVFKTTLGVRGEAALLRAIQDCWRSFLVFISQNGRPEGSGMAVLIQPAIKAECAGVCFSVDPLRGSRQETLISAAWGLGSGVVDGLVANDAYWLSRERLRSIRSVIVLKESQISLRPEGGIQESPVAEERRRASCLPDAWLGRIGRFAIAAEGLFGVAQDVEWAIVGNRLWLLQSRPITGLSEEITRTPPFPVAWPKAGDERRAWEPYPLAGHERDVLLPLERDCLAALESSREETCRFIGVDRNGRLAFFNGRPYFCDLPMNMSPADLRIRSQAMADLRGRLQQQNLTAWDHWGPEIVEAVGRLRDFEASAAGGPALADHLEEALAVRRRHFMLHPVMWFKPEAAYFEAFAALSGQTGSSVEAVAYRLIEGEENILSRMVDELYALALTARESPAVSALVSELAPDVISQLLDLAGPDRAVARDFLAQLEAFLAEYGERNGNGYGSEATICTITWNEEPAQVLRLVAPYLDPAVESPEASRRRARQGRKALIEALCQDKDEAAVAEFRRQLSYARKAYTVLEEHNHYIDQLGVGQLRKAILAAGRYLAIQGALADQDDVFWLRYDEVLTALHDGISERITKKVAERKAEHVVWQTLEPPPFLGVPEARLPERAPFQDDVTPQNADAGQSITGLGASPGRGQGWARVVRDRLSLPEISPGDILVAPNAGPLFTPLFPILGGLILDGGSLGQHAAVIAREYGLPAVIATRHATRQIPNGAWVHLDGTAGTVEIASQD